MKNFVQRTFVRSLCCMALVTCVAGARAEDSPDATRLLLRVDQTRAPELSTYIATLTIAPFDGNKAKTPVRYSVLTSQKNGAIVTCVDGDQTGQKFLATDRGFWFFAPRTHRAIRLTPSQLLRGEASVGDISRLNFSTDYMITGLDKGPKPASWTLSLKAKSPNATYAKAQIDTGGDGTPLGGRFYAASGKLLKRVEFGPVVSISGHQMIQKTTYIDGIDSQARTIVTYSSIKNATANAGMFTPEALATQ